MVTVSIKLKRLFFDRPEIRAQLGHRKAKALGYFGGDVQRKARNLIGKRAKRSKPRPAGKPPKSHVEDSNWASLRRILFYASPNGVSVVIGPVKANQVQQSAIDLGAQTVPQIQEHGGDVYIQEQQRIGWPTAEWRRRDLRFNPRPDKYRYRKRRARYPKRPFMNPGLEYVVERNRRRGKMPGLSVGPGASATIGPA